MPKKTQPYRVRFKIDKDVDKHDKRVIRFRRDIREMAARIHVKEVKFTRVAAEMKFFENSTGEKRCDVDVQFYRGTKRVLNMNRNIQIDESTLEHVSFRIDHPRNRGRGIPRDMLIVSKGLIETFDLKKLDIYAGSSDGGYVWLRYGFFPKYIKSLDEPICMGRADRLTSKQVERWMALSRNDKKRFVLTREFRDYRRAFSSHGWSGTMNVRNRQTFNLIFGDKKVLLANLPRVPVGRTTSLATRK